MPFELPENLHPDCGPVAWLLGRWGGRGHGDYPTIDTFEYGQELVFTHDGRPFFHYFARSWIVDENGEKVRDAAQEAGFLRCRPGGNVELLLSHTSGISEIWYGKAEDGKLELHTAGGELHRVAPRRSPAASGSTATSRATCSTPTTWPRSARSCSRTCGRRSSGSRTGRMSEELAARLHSLGYRLTPQRQLVLRGGREARPRHPRRGPRRGAGAVQRGQRLHGLPHARGARGARPGPARPPVRPRSDVPLGHRPRALPPGLPELPAGHLG